MISHPQETPLQSPLYHHAHSSLSLFLVVPLDLWDLNSPTRDQCPPYPTAVETQSPNHCTTREGPVLFSL